MSQQVSIFNESLRVFFAQLAKLLPGLFGALIILIVGWFVAKLLDLLIVRGMKLIKLDVLTEKAGIENFLRVGGVKRTSIEILGSIFYWLIIFIVLLASFNVLGLTVANDLFNQVVLFIPNIVVAILVLIIGLFLAKFVAQIVATYVHNIGLAHAHAIAKITQAAIIVFIVSITLTQLKIGEEIVKSAFQLFFGAICLALGLAFGLGGKDWAAKMVERYFKKE
jgi:hypothetical protein